MPHVLVVSSLVVSALLDTTGLLLCETEPVLRERGHESGGIFNRIACGV